MTLDKLITTRWDANLRRLYTQLRGPITTGDVSLWRSGLEAGVALIPDGARYQLLLDLRGFEPQDLEAHKSMRTVIPELLLRHGMRPAFIDLFDEKPQVNISFERQIECTAFANVHHDPQKMQNYEARIAKPNQRFFTDLEAAERWLATQL